LPVGNGADADELMMLEASVPAGTEVTIVTPVPDV
jgi:hypothetical protein